MLSAAIVRPTQMTQLETGYQSAISLLQYEGNLVWSRFNVLLAVQTLLLGGIGLLISENGDINFNSPILLPLSLIGLVICLVWFQVTIRGFSTLKLWTMSARELEIKIGNDDLKILQRGNGMRLGDTTSFDFPDERRTKDKLCKHHDLSVLRTQTCAYVLIGIFAILNLSLLFASISLYLFQ